MEALMLLVWMHKAGYGGTRLGSIHLQTRMVFHIAIQELVVFVQLANVKMMTKEQINELVKICYDASFNAGWHTDINTGELLDRNRAEMLCLVHSEISEAMEGERKGLMDDHLKHRPMAEVELADAVIRICDYAGRWGYDLGSAIMEKLEYNAKRADHKIENRLLTGGKKF